MWAVLVQTSMVILLTTGCKSATRMLYLLSTMETEDEVGAENQILLPVCCTSMQMCIARKHGTRTIKKEK